MCPVSSRIHQISLSHQQRRTRYSLNTISSSYMCAIQLLFFTTDAAVWTWNTVILDHVSTIAVHSHIPAYYLPCLAAVSVIIYRAYLHHIVSPPQIIQQVNPACSGHLKHIAQLLYESIVTQQNRANRYQDEYALCFNAVRVNASKCVQI